MTATLVSTAHLIQGGSRRYHTTSSSLSAVQKHCVAQILREPPLRVPYKHVPPVQTHTSLSCAIFASSLSCARHPGPTIDSATPRTAPGTTLDPHDAVSGPNLLISGESLAFHHWRRIPDFWSHTVPMRAWVAADRRPHPRSASGGGDQMILHVN